MSESMAPLRALPAATKWLAALLVSALSIAASVTSCVVYAQSFVRDDELRVALSAERLHYQEQDDERETQRKREQAQERDTDAAMMRRLVSLEAADIEPDRRKAAAAAAHARSAFDDAIARGVPLAAAAQRALDDLPPWRK